MLGWPFARASGDARRRAAVMAMRWATGWCAAMLGVLAHAQPAIHAKPETHEREWQVVAQGLHRPWALAFLPDGRFLVSERAGAMRIVTGDGAIGAPLAGVPDVVASGQGGLLDVVLDEDFAHNHRLYFCFSEAGKGGNSTALAEARLAADDSALQDVRVLFRQSPKVRSNLHFGCRIVLNGEHIFLSTGERYDQKEQAQRLDNHLGKIIRITREGGVPADNPFVNVAGALPEIWSYGHRNVQGLALDGTGQLWAHEHGAQGGDEINRIVAGENYGWPVISYGTDYGGAPIGTGKSAQTGLAQPVYYWNPSIAPSGMAFVAENPYGADWQGNVLIGALKHEYVARIVFDGQKIVREEKMPIGARVRDVRQAPDGYVYAITDARNGKILRLKAD